MFSFEEISAEFACVFAVRHFPETPSTLYDPAEYFLGIGGIGMSAIARYFNSLGVKVSGYDKTPTVLTKQLEAEGINIHYEDRIELVDKSARLVVFTPAVPEFHKYPGGQHP